MLALKITGWIQVATTKTPNIKALLRRAVKLARSRNHAVSHYTLTTANSIKATTTILDAYTFKIPKNYKRLVTAHKPIMKTL